MSESYKIANSKEIRDIVKAARKQGWRVEKGKNNHIMFYPPNSEEIINMASTPSSYRGSKNVRSLLKKNGLDI